MLRLPLKRTFATLVLLSLAGLSSASGLPDRWFLGNWTCNIDGRTGWMTWEFVDNSKTYCRNGVCSDTSSVAYGGWFKDSRGAGSWVKLIRSSSWGNDLRFIYLGDYTQWFLRYDPQTMIATGNTMWRGKSYPLQCSQGKG